MNNPNTIENQVLSILRENMEARNDDMKLYLLVVIVAINDMKSRM